MSTPGRELNCERQLDAAPYVLGALGQDDSYRSHLAGCPICQAEVADLQPVVDALPTTAPVAVASEALRGRVLATVRAEAELLRAAGRHADEAPRPSKRGRPSAWPALTVSVALAAAAAVVIAVSLSGGSSTRERVTPAQIAAGMRGASASLHQSGNRAELVLSGMPQPARGRIYEIWLSRATGRPVPTDALFGVTSRGDGSVGVPNSLRGVKEVLVTSEPLGGSAVPTSTPVIRVRVAA